MGKPFFKILGVHTYFLHFALIPSYIRDRKIKMKKIEIEIKKKNK